MSKLVYISKTAAAKFVGMTKQLFHYYDRDDRVPGRMIVAGHRVYNKEELKGWKPKYKQRINQK